MASKYDALRDHLRRQQGEVYLSFEEIEDILGLELPPASRRTNWWANSRTALNRAQRRSWGAAGYLAAPGRHGVVFRKA